MDRRLMGRALALAKRGEGRVSPNPMVGCVVASDGEIVGEGYHLFERRDHAEVEALRRAGARARGSDLYVNLEPCCHQGRTPPCVNQIIAAGVKRVFVAVRDPNPMVAGKGIECLRNSGIEVHEGLAAAQATRLNEIFLHYIQRRTPFVTLKLAMTLDGKIATANGDSRWITGERARDAGHHLRYRYDAILVGIGTILADNPSLDVRWRRRNTIHKIVLDSRLRTPVEARLFASGDPVTLFHAAGVSDQRHRSLASKANLVEVGEAGELIPWPRILGRLTDLGVTSLLIEGGGKTAASALSSGAVQRVNLFYGPKIVGGRDLSGVADLGIDRLSRAVMIEDLRLKKLGPDFLVDGRVGGRKPQGA